MKKQHLTLSHYWIGVVVIAIALVAMPTGHGLAQTATTPTVPQSPIETPTVVPTAVPTAVPVATSVPEGNVLGYHTVQPGETLFCIGRAYGVDPYAIASQNSILNPNLIHNSQRLAIPNVPRTLPSGSVCARQFNGTSPTTCRWNHTVVSGENLYRISLHYEVNMYNIAEANHIPNLNLIFIGQVLCIP